jgi:iron complex transport system substrate-binding protein
MIRYWAFLFFSLAILACTGGGKPTVVANGDVPDSTFEAKHAAGFSIDYFNGYKIIKVKNHFEPKQPPLTICVANQSIDKKKVVVNQYITTHNKRWVSLSSTHINTANLLGINELIVGVAEPHYISDPFITQKVKSGAIRNVGMAMAPDLEVVMSVEPSFVMVSPFPDITYSQIANAGIAVVPNASYLENTPLARAEWIIFVAALFDKEPQARELFNNIEKRYFAACEIAKHARERPSLFSGHLYQGIWYTSMGQNYMAKYYADAGANYIYKDVSGTGTLSLEFERVFIDAAKSDYWLLILNHPGELTYNIVAEMDERYTDFDAFKNKKIIYTNTFNSRFFEEGEQNPDIVLTDLTHALHPELNTSYKPIYFKVLK